MTHTTKSVNNPYGMDQVPEWELWEEAANARCMEAEHANAIAAWDRGRVLARDRATFLEHALTKLRPPKGSA